MPTKNERFIKELGQLGFEKNHLSFLREVFEVDEYSSFESPYPNDFPSIIATIFDTPEKRDLVFHPRKTNPWDADQEYETAKTFRFISKALRQNRHHPEEFVVNLKFITDSFFSQRVTSPKPVSRERLQHLISAATTILSAESIFAMFDYNPQCVVRLIDNAIGTDEESMEMDSDNLVDFFEDFDGTRPREYPKAVYQMLKVIFTDPQRNLDSDALSNLTNEIQKIECSDNPQVESVICLHRHTPDTWPDRLTSLDAFSQAFGLGQTTAEEVDDALFQMYANQLAKEDLSSQILARTADQVARTAAYYQQIIAAAPGEREQILTFMHRKLDVRGLIKLRRSLPESILRLKELEQNRDLARIYEHPLNPINRILAHKHGYEIEYPAPWEFDDDLESGKPSFQEIGIGMGDGGYGYLNEKTDICFDELSPGPFFHPSTAIAVFRSFLHSGLINPHLHFGHSIHLNTNALLDQNRSESRFHPTHLRPIAVSLLLTASAFDTRRGVGHDDPFSNDDGQYHPIIRLSHLKSDGDIFGNDETSDDDTYRDEIASFDLLDASLFAVFWHQFVTLSNTAGADLRLRRTKASSPHYSYLRQLSDNWKQHCADLILGMKSVGIGDFNTLSQRAYRKVKPLLLEVYPDEDRTANPDDIQTKHPVVIGDQRWPNIVSFVRDLNSRTCAMTQSIFGQFETQMIDNLRATIQDGSKEARKAFLKLYNLPATSPIEKTDTIEVLASLYSHRL